MELGKNFNKIYLRKILTIQYAFHREVLNKYEKALRPESVTPAKAGVQSSITLKY